MLIAKTHKTSWWGRWFFRLKGFILTVFILTASAHAQSPVTFCDLLRNPEKYNGQQVRVRATYRYGFEWSQLFCLECLEKSQAWLDTTRLNDDSVRAFRKLPGAGIVNLTVQGTFMSGSTYGHNNGYRYQIMAEEVRDVKILLKGMRPVEVEGKLEKKSACGGTNPK